MISTVSLIVPSLSLCSTAITFTAQLASDYLSLTHRNTNTEILTDTHTALFAYCFHLEIVILVIRQTERKHNYGTGFHLVTARLCECMRACACVYVISAMFLCQNCVAENVRMQCINKHQGSLCKKQKVRPVYFHQFNSAVFYETMCVFRHLRDSKSVLTLNCDI